MATDAELQAVMDKFVEFHEPQIEAAACHSLLGGVGKWCWDEDRGIYYEPITAEEFYHTPDEPE